MNNAMDASASSLNNLDGEREIPNVNEHLTNRWRRGALVLMMFMTLVITGTIAFIKFGTADESVDAVEQRKMIRASSVPARTFSKPPEPVAVAPAIPIIVPAEPVEPIVRHPLPAPRAIVSTPYVPATRTIDKAASRSQVMDARRQAATSSGALQAAQGIAHSGSGLLGAHQQTTNRSSGAGQSSLETQLSATAFQATTARQLQGRDFLLTRGSFIDCALNTRLDSTVPGLVSCVVTRDVFSHNGKLVLIDRGSRVTGEYRSTLQQGMNRLAVLWSRVETPAGVVIDLASPATDSLGTAGVTGDVDTHFWQRFGGAILLSLIDDAAQLATTVASDNGSDTAQVVIGGTANVSSDLAAEVLRNTINIAPTIHVHQGARVGIVVARDLDFSTVYDIVVQ